MGFLSIKDYSILGSNIGVPLFRESTIWSLGFRDVGLRVWLTSLLPC